MKLRPILGAIRGDGLQAIDMNAFAANIGMTRPALEKKLQSLGFQQVWSEAKRLSHERVFGTQDVLSSTVEDTDLLESASSLLDPPLPFTGEKSI